jgi:beta-lactamase superfamily II metal-dependent hydrolase
MHVTIFDVKAGCCALITTDDGKRIMVDCGTNADTGWTPGGYLRDRGISALDMLVITNFDEDHTRGYPSLAANGVSVHALLRNKSIGPADIVRMKDPDGGPGPGVGALLRDIGASFTGGACTPSAPDFNYEVAYSGPAAVGLESNSLSLMLLARCNGCNVLFTGDLDKPGWEALGDRARTLLRQTHIMIAPHHGREDGQWPGFAGNVPSLRWVVISDKGHMHDTQKLACPFYGALAQGWKFGKNLEQDRYVLTTRNDGSIAIEIDAQGNVRAWSFDESYAAMRAAQR